MEHIKAPVSVKRSMLFAGVIGADGCEVCSVSTYRDDAAGLVAEIVMAFDEHDALVAQRDALVAACEDAIESINLATAYFGITVAAGVFKGAFLGTRGRLVKALALVKGEQKSDDATT